MLPTRATSQIDSTPHLLDGGRIDLGLMDHSNLCKADTGEVQHRAEADHHVDPLNHGGDVAKTHEHHCVQAPSSEEEALPPPALSRKL